MLKKSKGNDLVVKRNSIPTAGITKEEREENLKVLEEVKSKDKKVTFLPQGFSYTGFKKKIS